MHGCLVEIQSCHGNVACFSKLGHVPAAFFFKKNVICFLSHTQLLCFFKSLSFFLPQNANLSACPQNWIGPQPKEALS